MPDEFQYDVFLSHSAKDKALVREMAERLRKDGLRVWFEDWEIRPDDSIPTKIEEGLERARTLVLCSSANALDSNWAQLESSTARFRDPLNKERRLVFLRLDDAPIRSSVGQLVHISWLGPDRELAYTKLLEACRPPAVIDDVKTTSSIVQLHLKPGGQIHSYAISADQTYILTGGTDILGPHPRFKYGMRVRPSLRMWTIKGGKCRRVMHLESDDFGHSFTSLALCADGRHAFSGSSGGLIKLWDLETGNVVLRLIGHTDIVWSLKLNRNQRRLLSSSWDETIRLWDVESGDCLQVLKGTKASIEAVSWSSDERQALSASINDTLRVWDLETGRCIKKFDNVGYSHVLIWDDQKHLAITGPGSAVQIFDLITGRSVRVFEGHTKAVRCVAWSSNQRNILSGGNDNTVRLWDIRQGRCLCVLAGHSREVIEVMWTADGNRAISADASGEIRLWDLTDFVKGRSSVSPPTAIVPEQIQYTNAKVLLVGDSNAGKTGLAHRLATDEWKASEDSTVGAWATQVKLEHNYAEPEIEREIWLWDFGGQADQRLIHQLYMDRTALILVLFNADQEDVLPGLRDWQTALRRSVKENIPRYLVAGRIDTGFKASRGKLQEFAKQQGLAYHETSAKSGDGCYALRAAMIAGIPWAQMEKRTSPRIFKLIKDEILKLRDEGQVLHTFKELRELLWQRLPDEPRFAEDTLQTVIGLLDGPGVVKELDYGTYILLAPEWINAYAQAVIRTLRSAENGLGVLPLRSIAEGKLIYQSIGRDGVPVEMKRLPAAEERVVLGEMERQLEQRGLCLRQGDKLVFPSHCGRDRPAVLEHPSVFVSYAVKGFLDDIYATLVVKLADSESFQLKELWRDAADFVTLAGDHHMGIKLTRASGSDGEISVYFGKGVTQEEQVIFANYIHAHLETSCEQAQRLRHYVCPKCHAPKGNPEVLMKKLLREKQNADTECDNCSERFALWDALEKKFASEAVRAQVEQLQAEDLVKLDTRRRGKLLALEVGARITSADQKCFEIPATEDEGLDMELEFTNDDGEGTGRRLYLQLKSGNSYLTKRKADGAEIFPIKKQRWVKYWLQQPHPVMLVIGTFSDEDERAIGKDKLEFAEVRWMEISSVLKRESANGKKPVKQIEFKGERLDLTSVRRWREKVLPSKSSQ